MKDPLFHLFEPVRQLMKFLKFTSILILLLLLLIFMRWIEIDIKVNGEKIIYDVKTTSQNVALMLKKANTNTTTQRYRPGKY